MCIKNVHKNRAAFTKEEGGDAKRVSFFTRPNGALPF